MAGRIVRLRTRADRMREDDGETLRQMVLDFAAGRRISQQAVGEIVSAIDRETAATAGWTFVMVSPQANAAVVRWLAEHSRRPQTAMLLWATVFTALRHDTCEITQTRAALAETLGVAPRHISEIMSELESIGAISRKGRGGAGVRYFLNPMVGSRLTGAERTRAQEMARPLELAPPPPKKTKPKLAVVPAGE